MPTGADSKSNEIDRDLLLVTCCLLSCASGEVRLTSRRHFITTSPKGGRVWKVVDKTARIGFSAGSASEKGSAGP